MKKGFYSASVRKPAGRIPAEPAPLREVQTKDVAKSARRGWRELYRRHEKPSLFVAGAALAVILVALHGSLGPAPLRITQDDIDQAVARTLETKPVPSPAMKAYQAVRSSVVRVRAIGDGLEYDEYMLRAIGSGVVIIDRGVILTSLHVVAGASRVRVQFEDGLEAEAAIISTQPENDLAVLQAKEIPDDLQAATLRSAKHLLEGEHVTAVGFPFGIGPSVSHGVISGLHHRRRGNARWPDPHRRGLVDPRAPGRGRAQGDRGSHARRVFLCRQRARFEKNLRGVEFQAGDGEEGDRGHGVLHRRRGAPRPRRRGTVTALVQPPALTRRGARPRKPSPR